MGHIEIKIMMCCIVDENRKQTILPKEERRGPGG